MLPPSKTSDQTVNRMKRYGGFFDMFMVMNDKIVTLAKIRKLVESGKKIIMGDKENPQFVKCGLSFNDPWDGTIPVVVASNHPRFIPGTRFDYGFMQVSLRDGYCISYNF